MTNEELIRMMRSDPTWLGQESADCIEELVKERDEVQAKLAKAVKTLKFYAPQTVGGITFVGGDDAGKRASTALAELEGEKIA